MSDNSQGNLGAGGDLFSTDDLTTQNGGGVAGVKIIRHKPCYGDDGDARDVSDSFPLPVKGSTLTKGTQGPTGFSVQDLKDAGRVLFSAVTPVAGTTCSAAEALMALDASKAAVALGGLSTIPVTAGKRLRITGWSAGHTSSAAAVISGRLFLRCNPSGAVVIGSPALDCIVLPSAPAVAQQGASEFHAFPEALEFSGTNQIGVSQVFSVATGLVWVSLYGYEY